MAGIDSLSAGAPDDKDAILGNQHVTWDRLASWIYALLLVASISTWLLAVNAPLRLDELGTYWQIKAGISEIWPRNFVNLSSPEYGYILWLSTKLIGTSEIALRIPSILAMLCAVYLLYLAARELFDRDIALVAAIVFCLHPIVAFASIDARPYAFAALAVNFSILILLKLRHHNSNLLAALFGLSAACIVWLQFLFVDILPAFLLLYFAIKECDRKALWRQFGITVAVFAVACLPVIPIMQHLFRTSKSHVYESAPTFTALAKTLAPDSILFISIGIGLAAFLVAAAKQQPCLSKRSDRPELLICVSLALVPLLILYGVSLETSLHTFTSYHRLTAIPGIALCWSYIIARLHSRVARVMFCIALVAITAYQRYSSPFSREHESSMKYAIELAEKKASIDDAPVVMCSGFVESNFTVLPTMETVKDSELFAQLSYYKLSVPVVPLPQLFGDQTVQISSRFLQEATRKHQHFLVVADKFHSYQTLDWFSSNASTTYSVHNLGVYSGFEVLEFDPRAAQVH